MSLLEDIQHEAVSSTGDLGSILRKCKLLAARLGSRPLEDWLLWESNGYPRDVLVPEYRTWPLQLKGHFAGRFGAAIHNAPIPTVCLPSKARLQYERFECRQSIASIEKGLEESQGVVPRVGTSDLSVVLGEKVFEGYTCMEAWAEFSPANLHELLNSVRNRVLDFAIAIGKEALSAGDTAPGGPIAIPAARVTQIFNTVVNGGVANLMGSVENVALTVQAGDFGSLAQALSHAGIGEGDLKELRQALQSEPAAPASAGRFGPRVAKWLGGAAQKAAEGTLKVGIEVAGKVLSEAITKYYGS